jgi:spore maturation protein A
MNALTRALRSFLNINTIWGLMILTAFVLCVVQHYQATTTALPVDGLDEGGNTITIRTMDRQGQIHNFDYTLTLRAGELLLKSDDQVEQNERPWLISTRPAGNAFLLKWDCGAPGPYELLVGGQLAEKGRLVRLESLTDAAFDYAESGFKIALGLVAAMVLFLGLMKVGENAGIVQLVAKAFYPIIRFLFPEVPKEHPANGAILMNVTTTVLGLGNAATPFGIKAMKELQTLNPHPEVATDSQVMLLGYNTAGFALLPTTLLAVRKSAGCSDPAEIIGTCMVAGAVSTLVAILMVKLLGKLPFFSLKAALAEQDRPTPLTSPTDDPSTNPADVKKDE